MTIEKVTTLNLSWTVMTGDAAYAEARQGRVRAAGPFMHPILAGTVGASLGVMLAFLTRSRRSHAVMLAGACALAVYSSASSGPVITLAAGSGALALWSWRERLGLIRTCALLTLVGLHIVMNAPVWYLAARLDLAGGSTGWHRAELISQALAHIDRWWLIGTDYTRDWFVYGMEWTTEMVDITNLYIHMGVQGGLLLMLLFIALLLKSFQLLGQKMAALRMVGNPSEFMLWCIGAALFAHCVTFLSVTYYDQSAIFFCLIIGLVPGLCSLPLYANTYASAGRIDSLQVVTEAKPPLDYFLSGESSPYR